MLKARLKGFEIVATASALCDVTGHDGIRNYLCIIAEQVEATLSVSYR